MTSGMKVAIEGDRIHCVSIYIYIVREFKLAEWG